ncbi:Uncharacterised protein [Listeria grayi]|uniref:UDP-N-acetyl-D-mannosamine dehydrogenase n=1 Tax=Listeria grayi TaxID=1641 RepID=A0A378MDH4_LISGR|nr:Uncharacterised protein [Listeria grayi]
MTGSDLALVLTDHKEYKELNKYVTEDIVVFDTKNIVDEVGIDHYYNFNSISEIK